MQNNSLKPALAVKEAPGFMVRLLIVMFELIIIVPEFITTSLLLSGAVLQLSIYIDSPIPWDDFKKELNEWRKK